jgi:hypothetical protein
MSTERLSDLFDEQRGIACCIHPGDRQVPRPSPETGRYLGPAQWPYPTAKTRWVCPMRVVHKATGCEVRNTKIASPGEYGLKSVENWHPARVNGAVERSMAHVSHQPGPQGPVPVEGVVRRRLVGVVGFGAELRQRPHAARGGALLQFDWRTKKNARCPGLCLGPGPEGLAGMAELRRLFPGGPGGGENTAHTRLF